MAVGAGRPLSVRLGAPRLPQFAAGRQPHRPDRDAAAAAAARPEVAAGRRLARHLAVPHARHDPAAVGSLLASEITAGRTDIADTLTASAFGQHPISGITRAGVGALLGSDRPDRWEQVATLLRNAGRQEGLRSAVLEAVDLAHPDAFGRILDVVVADDLARFAATVRAAGVWFGEELTVRTSRQLTGVLTELARGLADPALVAKPGTPTETFIRLTALAYRDAHEAIPRAAELLGDPDAGIRRAAARLLAELGLVAARDALRPALADPDLTVYATAVSAWPTSPFARDLDARLDDDGVAVLLDRVRTLGKARKVDTGLIGSRMLEVSSAHAADVILAHRTVAAAPAEALAAASPDGRAGAARRLAADPVANRAALFAFLTDSSSSVRRDVYDALGKLPDITAGGDSPAARRAASQGQRPSPAGDHDAAAPAAGGARRVGSHARLPAPRSRPARPASSPSTPACPPRTGRRSSRRARSPRHCATEPPTGRRPTGHRPCRPTTSTVSSPAAGASSPRCARGWPSTPTSKSRRPYDGVSLLANLRWLPSAPPGSPLPLPEVLGPWWERTAPALSDGGVELLLLALAVPRFTLPWAGRAAARVIGSIPADPTASALVWPIIDRLARTEFRSSWVDARSGRRHRRPRGTAAGPAARPRRRRWPGSAGGWNTTRGVRNRSRRPGRLPRPGEAAAAGGAYRPPARPLVAAGPLRRRARGHLRRLRRPPRAARPVPAAPGRDSEQVLDQPWRYRPSPELLCRAVDAGAATRADLLDALVTVDANGIQLGSYTARRTTLEQLSARRPPEWAPVGGRAGRRR